MSDITPLTEKEEIERYAWSSGDRMNDLRIALKSLTTVRLCVNKPSADYSAHELHPLTEQLDKLYDELEEEMFNYGGLTGEHYANRRKIEKKKAKLKEQQGD
mgnify:CR=1 FL=1